MMRIIPRFYRHETQFVEKGYKHDPAVGMYLEKEDTAATVARYESIQGDFRPAQVTSNERHFRGSSDT